MNSIFHGFSKWLLLLVWQYQPLSEPGHLQPQHMDRGFNGWMDEGIDR